MSKKVTPLNLAIQQLEKVIADWDLPNTPIKGAQTECLQILRALLPTEQEFAEECFESGGDFELFKCDKTNGAYPNFTDFINQYNSEK